MKVAILSHALIHGRQIYFAMELANQGIDVFAVAPAKWGHEVWQPEPGEEELGNYRRVGVPVLNEGNIYTYSFLNLNLLEQYRPDIIYAQAEPPSFAAVQAMQYAQRLGAKLITFSWENIPQPPTEIEVDVLKASSLVVGGTNQAKKVLLGKGVPESRIRVIPQAGLPLHVFKPDGPPISKRKYDLLYSGRMVASKGIHYIISALQDTDVKMLWRGRGPITPSLGDLDSEWLTWPQMARAYQKSKLFIYYSFDTRGWREQFAYAPAEAVASGTPAIVSDSGAMPETLPCAQIIPQRNPTRLRETILTLLKKDDLEATWKEQYDFVTSHYANTFIAEKAKCAFQEIM